MSRITEEQKKKFYNLYKEGYRSKVISRETGITPRYVRKVLLEFKSGNFSWLNSGYRHHVKLISEDERKRIVEELSESSLSLSEAVSRYGFPEDVLWKWKKNYNEYGACSRKRGRLRKDGSNDKRPEENQITARRDYYLQNVLPCLRGKRDGSAKKRLYERLANAEDLESLSDDVLKSSD